MTVSGKILEWFDKRGIDAETVIKSGIYSGRHVPAGDDKPSEVVADPQGNIIVFPFIDQGRETGAKYRAAGKKFWQRPNARKTFWNADILDDPSLKNGTAALVITEGEMDALSVLQSGYPFVVSVPDGAPPARDKDGKLIDVPKTSKGIDPEHDDKYSFIFNNWDRLKQVKRIIIATDGDEPGKRLAEELVRRLDRIRCLWIEYPENCKDFNDVLTTHGGAEVMRTITTAREYPVSGLYRLSEIPAEPDLDPMSTGWGLLDPLVKVFTPCLMVVTGFAGIGKSTWATQLVAHLAKFYGWSTAIASFEMRVRPYITDTLGTVYLDRPRWTMSPMGDRTEIWNSLDTENAERWIERHFVFIGPDPQNDDQDHDIQWLIDTAEAAVIRHGVRVLLVDPWNEIEHLRRRDENGSDYVGRALRLLKVFAKRFGVLVIVVAHPTKGALNKGAEAVTLYDISDSAHFANKADIGVVIARIGNGDLDFLTSVMVKKIRYQPDTGKPGTQSLQFDPVRRIFFQ